VGAINRLVAGPGLPSPETLAFMEAVTGQVRPRTDASPLFSDEALRRLSMPVLLLGGERDAVRDCHAIAARLQRLVPRFESQLLPDAGHVLLGAAPQIAPFLERLDDAATASGRP